MSIEFCKKHHAWRLVDGRVKHLCLGQQGNNTLGITFNWDI
jgi:hypothetical protein